jgi:hypothetical protein
MCHAPVCSVSGAKKERGLKFSAAKFYWLLVPDIATYILRRMLLNVAHKYSYVCEPSGRDPKLSLTLLLHMQT